MFKCVECGEPEDANYCEGVKAKMVERQLCFECNFWIEKIEEFPLTKNRYIINHNHFQVVPNPPTNLRCFAGYGGAEFKIKPFNSTDIIVTRNLWHQGEIPKRFRERFPNNAEFVE